MAKDARLDLGRYVQNPFNRQGQVTKQLDFNELFRAKPSTGAYPWNPSRFTEEDLVKRMMTRKQNLNPGLNFVSNSPFFDNNEGTNQNYELFEGLGRFNRPEDYDFDEGRARTSQRPQEQPDYNPQWIEAYNLSPTLSPDKKAKNVMPRLRNPDPKGILMAAAEKRAEAESEDKPSIAQLLERQSQVTNEQKQVEDKQANNTIKEEKDQTSTD